MQASAAVSKSELRAQRAASASRYTPRPGARAPVARPVVDMRLRRLTAQVLDDLKLPGAIPSEVIYAALEKAASQPSVK